MHLIFCAIVLSVKLVVQRSSLDLLDSLPIAVVVQNSASTPQTLHFTQPAEYAIELRAADGSLIWTSPGAAGTADVPAYPEHARMFAPGSTTLAVYDWNALLSNGNSPPPGGYTLRVRLIVDKPLAGNSIHVTFAPPISPSSLAALHPGQDFTLAGTLDAQHAALSDPRGSAPLSRRLVAAPVGTIILVRGFAAVLAGGSRVFTVERWAMLNVPQPTSTR